MLKIFMRSTIFATLSPQKLTFTSLFSILLKPKRLKKRRRSALRLPKQKNMGLPFGVDLKKSAVMKEISHYSVILIKKSILIWGFMRSLLPTKLPSWSKAVSVPKEITSTTMLFGPAWAIFHQPIKKRMIKQTLILSLDHLILVPLIA